MSQYLIEEYFQASLGSTRKFPSSESKMFFSDCISFIGNRLLSIPKEYLIYKDSENLANTLYYSLSIQDFLEYATNKSSFYSFIMGMLNICIYEDGLFSLYTKKYFNLTVNFLNEDDTKNLFFALFKNLINLVTNIAFIDRMDNFFEDDNNANINENHLRFKKIIENIMDDGVTYYDEALNKFKNTEILKINKK